PGRQGGNRSRACSARYIQYRQQLKRALPPKGGYVEYTKGGSFPYFSGSSNIICMQYYLQPALFYRHHDRLGMILHTKAMYIFLYLALNCILIYVYLSTTFLAGNY